MTKFKEEQFDRTLSDLMEDGAELAVAVYPAGDDGHAVATKADCTSDAILKAMISLMKTLCDTDPSLSLAEGAFDALEEWYTAYMDSDEFQDKFYIDMMA